MLDSASVAQKLSIERFKTHYSRFHLISTIFGLTYVGFEFDSSA